MNLTLIPQSGKFQVKLPCSITSDYDETETLTGLGTVSMDAQQLIELASLIDSQLGRVGRAQQHWSSPDGHNAWLTLLPNGCWSIWSSAEAPNLGPLRNLDDYRRQVTEMRAAGMVPQHRGGRSDV